MRSRRKTKETLRRKIFRKIFGLAILRLVDRADVAPERRDA